MKRNFQNNIFTLIELLLVCAILAILSSMLLPVLSRVKARAKSIQCIGNIRQCGTASMMYIQDNKEYMLLYFNDNISELTWVNMLIDGNYLMRSNVLLCPAQAPYIYKYDSSSPNYGRFFSKYDQGKRYVYGVEYGMDIDGYRMIYSNNARLRLTSAIKGAAGRILLSDSIWGPDYPNSNARQQCWVVMYHLQKNQYDMGVHLRHPEERSSTLFWDGHAGSSGISELRNAGFMGAFGGNYRFVPF